MKAYMVCAALALALLLLPGCGSGEPETTGSNDLSAATAAAAKIVESMGGEKALAGIRGFSATFEGTYRSGPMNSPYQAETHWKRSGALCWTLTSDGFDGMMGVAEDGTPWSAFMAPPARGRGPFAKSMREWRVQWDVFLVQPLLVRNDVTLSLGDEDGTLVVTLQDGDRYDLTYATTGAGTFLTSMRGPMMHLDGQAGRLEVDWSEPTTFDKITLPAVAAVRTYLGDEVREQMEEKLTGVAWNPDFIEGRFDMPAPGMEFGKPGLTEVPAMNGLVVMHKGPYESVDETMGRAKAVAAERGMILVGGVIAAFLDDPATVPDPNDLRTEIVLPVMVMGPPPELPEGFELREFAAMTVASMNVRGEYGSVEAEAIPKVAQWMVRNGHAFAGAPRMVYHHDPESTVPEDQVSEVQIPVGE